jgi:hypothetical protein
MPNPVRMSRRRDDPRQRPAPKEVTTFRRTTHVAVPILIGAALGAVVLIALAPPAFAASTGAPSLNSVIDNLRAWLVGILAGVATLFLTVGGLRYLAAGGDPSQVEKAKVALKSAAVGYALAILAPLLVSIIASIVGAR